MTCRVRCGLHSYHSSLLTRTRESTRYGSCTVPRACAHAIGGVALLGARVRSRPLWTSLLHRFVLRPASWRGRRSRGWPRRARARSGTGAITCCRRGQLGTGRARAEVRGGAAAPICGRKDSASTERTGGGRSTSVLWGRGRGYNFVRCGGTGAGAGPTASDKVVAPASTPKDARASASSRSLCARAILSSTNRSCSASSYFCSSSTGPELASAAARNRARSASSACSTWPPSRPPAAPRSRPEDEAVKQAGPKGPAADSGSQQSDAANSVCACSRYGTRTVARTFSRPSQ